MSLQILIILLAEWMTITSEYTKTNHNSNATYYFLLWLICFIFHTLSSFHLFCNTF